MEMAGILRISGILGIMLNGQVPKIPDIPSRYYIMLFFLENPHNRLLFIRLCGFSLSPNNFITSIPRTSYGHFLRHSQKSAEIHSNILSP